MLNIEVRNILKTRSKKINIVRASLLNERDFFEVSQAAQISLSFKIYYFDSHILFNKVDFAFLSSKKYLFESGWMVLSTLHRLARYAQ
jgi:hypothetical protein